MPLKHPVQRNVQLCGARHQDQIKDSDLDEFVKRTTIQLRNLLVTYKGVVDDMDIYDIREMFQESDVPFRYKGCSRGNLTCCGTCMFKCPGRCPQDVMYRAYLLCGHLLDAPEGTFEERWNNSSATSRMMYKELTSEHPRFKVVLNILEDNFSIRSNKNLRATMLNGESADNPNKLNYAPTFAYEQRVIKLPNGDQDVKYIPKANPETGDFQILHWPRSGVCPFCIPCGIINRSRIKGPNRGYGGRKKKGDKHERKFDARYFEDED